MTDTVLLESCYERLRHYRVDDAIELHDITISPLKFNWSLNHLPSVHITAKYTWQT